MSYLMPECSTCRKGIIANSFQGPWMLKQVQHDEYSTYSGRKSGTER